MAEDKISILLSDVSIEGDVVEKDFYKENLLFCSQKLNYRGTLRMISLRCFNRFSSLLAQNDRLVLSFRLRGHSTSSFTKKFLPHQKCKVGGTISNRPPPHFGTSV